MKISVEWLNEKNACSGAVKEFAKQSETDSSKIILEMISQKKYLDWGSWLIARTMTRLQYLAYAIYAAEQVINLFEKEYPYDKRPRLAIEAAKAVLTNDNEETWAARAATEAAAWAAGDAGAAAEAAAWAAGAAGDAGAAARAAAWAAEAAAQQKMQIKILRYGLKLLKEPTQ